MQTEFNKKTQIDRGNEVRIARGLVGLFIFSILFFAGMISFASIQQKSSLEANMVEAISPNGDLTFQFVGTEDSPQLRKFYLVEADGEEFFVRVYQNNTTVLDAFNLSENPQLVEQFQAAYGVSW